MFALDGTMTNNPNFAIASHASTALREMLAKSDVHEPVFSFSVVKDETQLSRRLARMYASGAPADEVVSAAKESITEDSILCGTLFIDIVSRHDIGDFPLVTIGGMQFAIGDTRALFGSVLATLDLIDEKFVFLSIDGARLLPR
jgi:hypothetical protein